MVGSTTQSTELIPFQLRAGVHSIDSYVWWESGSEYVLVDIC